MIFAIEGTQQNFACRLNF